MRNKLQYLHWPGCCTCGYKKFAVRASQIFWSLNKTTFTRSRLFSTSSVSKITLCTHVSFQKIVYWHVPVYICLQEHAKPLGAGSWSSRKPIRIPKTATNHFLFLFWTRSHFWRRCELWRIQWRWLAKHPFVSVYMQPCNRRFSKSPLWPNHVRVNRAWYSLGFETDPISFCLSLFFWILFISSVSRTCETYSSYFTLQNLSFSLNLLLALSLSPCLRLELF